MLSRLMPWYANFTQIPVGGSLNEIVAAALGDTVVPHSSDRCFPPFLHFGVLLEGVINNADITVSIGITDANGLTLWTPTATQEVRTLPGGAVVVGMFTFSTLHAAAITVALESAIVGGGTAKLYICFSEENL